jgi:phage FluMu protein Com
MVEEALRDFGIKLEQQVPGNHLVRSVHENIKLGSDCPFSENKQEERRSKSDNETIKVVRSLSALNTPDPKEYDARSINHSDIMSVEKSSSMRDKDRQQDKKELKCPYCEDLVFYSEKDLKEHVRARHKKERRKERAQGS